MSKPRLAVKLQRNAEYPVITEFLTKIGFRYRLCGPTGKGHPFLQIDLPDGRAIDHFINSTPKAGGNPRAALSKLRKRLRAEGYDIGK